MEHSKVNSINRLNRLRHAPLRLICAAPLVALVIAAGACRSIDEAAPVAVATPAAPTPAAPTPAAPSAAPTVKKSAVRLPRIEAALKKAIAARLKTWQASIEARDLEKHVQHYADQIETYYLTSNADRAVVRADRERAFKQFDTLKMEIINVEINLETTDAAIVTFDKGWDFKKDAAFSNGLVRQELQMRKIERQWFIVAEKDLQVYRREQ